MPPNPTSPVVQDVTQADRDAAATLTGEEAMAYGFADLSDAVQAFARHRLSTTPIPETDDYRRGIEFTPRMIENLRLAESLVSIGEGWGHGPGGKGKRIAGFYYDNSEAKKANVFPAHCVGAIRDLILALSEHLSSQEDHRG